jgi:hypothetical protein
MQLIKPRAMRRDDVHRNLVQVHFIDCLVAGLQIFGHLRFRQYKEGQKEGQWAISERGIKLLTVPESSEFLSSNFPNFNRGASLNC